MSRKKSEKNVRNIPITVRLNEEESRYLRNCAAVCSLSVAEFMRQLCRGNAPQPVPQAEFWDLLNTLYEVHAAFKKCVPFFPTAAEICKEIEQLAVDLQQRFTMPQPFDIEKYIRKGAV